MIWWSILTGLLVGTLAGETWMWWRDRAPQQPRHPSPVEQGRVFDWLNRKPTDLDAEDRAHRGRRP